MTRVTLVPLALVAAVAVLAGCGGRSDSEAVADTVTSYLSAFGAGDGQEACDTLTDETKLVVASRVAEKLGGRDCPDAVRALASRLPDSQALAFTEARVTRVDVRGDAAEARFRAGRARGVARLRKTGDGWKISLLPQVG